jgi:hypothetical protein
MLEKIERAANKWKVIILEVKVEWKIKWSHRSSWP